MCYLTACDEAPKSNVEEMSWYFNIDKSSAVDSLKLLDDIALICLLLAIKIASTPSLSTLGLMVKLAPEGNICITASIDEVKRMLLDLFAKRALRALSVSLHEKDSALTLLII
jgi:hypothetical protein